MKKSKVFLLAAVGLLSVGVLTACSSSSKTSGKTYNYVYGSDPATLDYLATNKKNMTTAVSNGVDGLFENDQYGNLKPSVAEDWSVSQDGLTYTYKIRKGLKWYTSDGEEYANVTAKDFVTGLKHAADTNSEAIYLLQNSIKGLNDYLSGANKDFSNVGIKAVDDYTLQYTLSQPEPYWNSKLTYSVTWPVNGDFLKSKGKDFGKSTDPTSILYNGPYLLKALTTKSSIEFTKNENYWDKDHVYFDNIKLTYDDGSDQESLERNFTDGVYNLARLFPTSSNYSKVEKQYKDNIFYTQPGSAVEGVGINIDRQTYGHTSKENDQQKTSTKTALLNKDFRQSLGFAIDRTNYAAQLNGKEGGSTAVRNIFVKPDFVQADGKDFGTMVMDQLPAYGDEWSGVNLADSQDGLYNPEKAKAEFAKAKEALQAEGVQFPIHLDVPVNQSSKITVNQVQSIKQSVESALGKDNVVLDIHQLSADDFNNITYSASNAAAEDWDLSVGVAWDPDYLDPSTYLDVLKTTSSENTKSFMGYDDPNSQAVQKVGLKEYDQLVEDASKETTDLKVRYEKYAKAQAWLTDSALYLPTTTYNGAAAVISRIKPFSGAYAQAGDKGSSYYFKYLKSQDDIVTKKQYDSAYKDWLKERAKSNDKAQKDLAKHVK
ncbi:peptide ABC transporter ATP-binding protein [Streptococcus salivarius]|uniref:peptide ABC transporter substrate-binding protein n=2 Tax=Streptococcus TaxID=1301 RepID=UPI0012E1A6A4|nr:peptide ABC transporter substrate-binding protein [Streptococcus salivarius]MBT0940802.1 peptide ABC transporter substrate-binding protein [Streptococcus salivarius]MBT1029799.1 peptide ABC transporter substrate-binding protein [Streptococcus salivarius]QGU79414.1 peptide ABC transporter ATP-binding protein [Streptococcus salivarius]QGU83428.1 peptide ABC transporter ATP-binding protein [Streptococcus salivarius]